MKTNRRQFPRYSVRRSDYLRGHLMGAKVFTELATIGKGGCSFLAHEADENFFPPRGIAVSLQTRDGEMHELKGQLLYLYPKAVGGVFVFSYGVQFHESERVRLFPMIDRLEKLATCGELDRA